MIDGTKKAIEAASKLVTEVADTKNGAEAKQELGKTALTVTRAINNVLLPLAAVNYAIEKAHVYFERSFPEELAAVTSEIPEEAIREPRPSVAGPVMQGLAYSYEEEPLKEMYLRLLRSAMDGRMKNGDHPAFSEVVKQLTVEEAQVLPALLGAPGMIAIVKVVRKAGDKGHVVLERFLIDLHKEGEIFVHDNLQLMVDNLIRLGLVEVDFLQRIADDADYDWVQLRPEFKKHLLSDIDGKISFNHGTLSVTNFGREFGLAVS